MIQDISAEAWPSHFPVPYLSETAHIQKLLFTYSLFLGQKRAN